jgi:hypothetical protein
MPKVEIEAGEREAIVEPDQIETGKEYYIRVDGAPIRVAKRKRFLGTSKGIKLPDTTGIPITAEEERIGNKDGIYAKNVGEEPTVVEWQKTGLQFGVISLGQQAGSPKEVNRLFERDNALDIENGDSVEIDLTAVGRHDLEVAWNVDTAVDVDVKVSNTGEFSGEEWTVDTISSGDYSANTDYNKGYDVNTFRFVKLQFAGSGTGGDSGVAEISGAR